VCHMRWEDHPVYYSSGSYLHHRKATRHQ
jgi:hypothetical protein